MKIKSLLVIQLFCVLFLFMFLANEIVKFISGKPFLKNKILVMDLNENKIRIIKI